MMCGGASTPSQFAHKLDHGDSCGHSGTELRQLYTQVNANVTAANIMNGNTVYGSVTKSGEVIVDGKVVATEAISYGRTNLAGSHAVGSSSDPLYGRSPSVSFLSSSLPAMVHVVNGQFRYAIVESCGNLVTATAKLVPAKAVTKVIAPATTINVTQVQFQAQSQAAPPAQVVATPVAKPAATPALPQTGATATGLFGMSLLCTAAWYWRRSQRGVRLALRLPSL